MPEQLWIVESDADGDGDYNDDDDAGTGSCSRRTSVGTTIRSMIRRFDLPLEQHLSDVEAFYAFEARDLVRKYETWRAKLPRVRPFYAVKCNPHPSVLKILACLGSGFDCASKKEMEQILALGVDPSRIVFANPARLESHLRYAREHRIDLLSVDCENEMRKIARLYPRSRLLLRIRSDSHTCTLSLGHKFGCEATEEAPQLLRKAKAFGLNVVGVCFHVGFECREAAAYQRAIAAARRLFAYGIKLGFAMTVLDIGGGYPGESNSSINAIAEAVNQALDKYFGDLEEKGEGGGVEIIGEPGTYFVASAFTLACVIHSKRTLRRPTSGQPYANIFFITDGNYGSLRGSFTVHHDPGPIPLPRRLPPTGCAKRRWPDDAGVAQVGGGGGGGGDGNNVDEPKLMACCICGPTCDTNKADVVATRKLFPNLSVGDWIMFENQGAYSTALASTFHGFPVPPIYTVLHKSFFSASRWDIVSQAWANGDETFIRL